MENIILEYIASWLMCGLATAVSLNVVWHDCDELPLERLLYSLLLWPIIFVVVFILDPIYQSIDQTIWKIRERTGKHR